MKRTIKNLITSVISIAAAFSLTITGSADFSNKSIVSKDDDGYAETFAEADAKGILYGKPLTEKTRDELMNEGYLFYDESNIKLPVTRATQTGVLGYVNGSGTYNVRETSGGTGKIVGTVKQKDIVRVNSISGSFANVNFIAADGTTKTGYMLNSGIYTPAYNWDSPTGTYGSVSQHYGDTDTNPSGHTGVDVAGSSISLKAVNGGTATFKIATVTDGITTYYAEYGRYVFLDTTAGSSSKRAVYAHLSSFNGYDTPNYLSEGYPGKPELRSTLAYEVKGSKYVSKGQILGKTGHSGQASGDHLHFEVRTGTSTTREDPFLYVVFPKLTKA